MTAWNKEDCFLKEEATHIYIFQNAPKQKQTLWTLKDKILIHLHFITLYVLQEGKSCSKVSFYCGINLGVKSFKFSKEDVVCIYNGILLSHKKEWTNAICSNTDATREVILSEVSQKKKRKYHMISLHVTSKIWHKRTSLHNRNGLPDIDGRLVVAKGRRERRRDRLGVQG